MSRILAGSRKVYYNFKHFSSNYLIIKTMNPLATCYFTAYPIWIVDFRIQNFETRLKNHYWRNFKGRIKKKKK
jgi:hypothetical protein